MMDVPRNPNRLAMRPPGEYTHQTLLDLELLEADSTPLFVIKTEGNELKTFGLDPLFFNEAFRKSGLKNVVLALDQTTILFRSWAHARHSYKQPYKFAGRTWSIEIAGKDASWRVLRAVYETQEEEILCNGTPSPGSTGTNAEHRTNGYTSIYRYPKDRLLEEIGRQKNAVSSGMQIPSENLEARWESIQTMMEMSEVGVFEYSLEGHLIHANEAWYRLSSYPRDLPAHAGYTFMKLVHPEDQALVMNKWNSLISGSPVTFEMRWRFSADSPEPAQWVLSASVPVYDEEGNLTSIAGNTIDINLQKRSQEIARDQVEALERVRLSELKFARFAQLSPTAIFIYVPETGMTFCNDQFFELTGHSRKPVEQVQWSEVVAEEDEPMMREYWMAIVRGEKLDTIQFRVKKTWIDQEGQCSNVWVQSTSYPEQDANGKVISIMGTLFDISQFKWAENVQQQRIKEAVGAKQKQENFIDMTSHELRNPLSAVVQCADSVISTLRATSLFDNDQTGVREDLIDSLQTIVQCSIHQKRVIDDVLTLSKLDSTLILITPMRVQPATVVSDALKLFDVECSQMDIKLELRLDESFEDFSWMTLDPSRLLQVLFNLVTNAIKFTKDRPTRKITITMGGSRTRPPRCWQNITFTNDEIPRANLVDAPEWGTGEKAYLWLQVEDTGCGMSLEEQKKLFSRFSQASPRTHIKYGGSGLGLFISKSLTTLQGGAIGVKSKSNIGSVFAFFISTRIAEPPAGHGMPTRPEMVRTISDEDAMRAIKLNVLIVEDNLVNQKVLRKQLQRFGWNISVAGNGQEALDWLKESEYWRGNRLESGTYTGKATLSEPQSDGYFPSMTKQPVDIILMDIEMPVMDGLTCAQKIRDYEQQGLLAPPRTPSRRLSSASSLTPITPSIVDHTRKGSRLPILAVSANARAEQVNQAVAAGMDDAIAKPFRIPELWPKIQELVGRVAEK